MEAVSFEQHSGPAVFRFHEAFDSSPALGTEESLLASGVCVVSFRALHFVG